MTYSLREKLGHFNKLRAASHLEADIELLKKLDPKHELLKKRIGGSEKYQQDILYVLLDHTTACDIKDFRREFNQNIEEIKGLADFITSYNEGVEIIFEKYGSEYIVQDINDVKDILSKINTPYKPEDCEVFIGMPLSELKFLETIVFEPKLSKEILNAAFESVLSTLLALKEVESLLKEADTTDTGASNSEVQESSLSEEKKVFGTKVSDYKTESKTDKIDEKAEELDEKEDELNSRESDLDEKESDLEEKEQELIEKEQELDEKAAIVEKKSASKKPNTLK